MILEEETWFQEVILDTMQEWFNETVDFDFLTYHDSKRGDGPWTLPKFQKLMHEDLNNCMNYLHDTINGLTFDDL